jgi:gliding motility-associated-like protein
MKRVYIYVYNISMLTSRFSLLLALHLCLATSSVYAQETVELSWMKQFGAAGNDRGRDMVLDAAGNVYTTGAYANTVDFDPGSGTFNLTSTGGSQIFVSKLDVDGNFVWAKSMGGSGGDTGQGIGVDDAGNVYITGGFTGTADFDPGPGSFTLTAATTTEYDIFVVKLNASGDFVWAKGVTGGTWWDSGYDLAVDAIGNVHVVGRFYFQGGPRDFDPGPGTFFLTAGQEDVFILKLDTNGNFVWARDFGAGSLENRGYSILLDASGNVYTTGYFEGTIDFDPGVGTANLTASGDWDIFYSKLDANGNFLWARSMVNSITNYYTIGDHGSKIALDAAGNLYATGRYNGTVDFDMGAGTFNLTASGGGYDIYLTKLNPSGDFEWAKSMGGTGYDEGFSIAVDDTGNKVYLAGLFVQTVDFDPGPGTFNLTSLGGDDVFFSKFDGSGNFVWATSLGSTGGDQGYYIAPNSSGDLNVVGYFQGTVDFDPSACALNLTSLGGQDMFIGKLKETSLIPPPTISGFSPPSGPIGTTVIITGTNFSTIPGNNIVRFNVTPAVVIASTSTSITTTVPSGATTGRVIVTVNCIPAQSASDFTVTAPTPKLTSFNPTSGPIGTIVTITGSNFSATPANNIVYFGATKATVTSATSTQLTTTVPAGATYQPISVTVSGLTTFSSKPFNITFCSVPGISSGSLATPVNFGTGTSSGPVSIALGDLDGDGKADLAVANRFANTISVFRNTSSGPGSISYASKIDFATGSEPVSITFGDLDGDGKGDLAVAIFGEFTVSVFRNISSGAGNIGFAPKVDFLTGPAGAGPFSVALGDLDKDGKTDLAVANNLSNQASVLLNTSSGTGSISFAARVDFPTGAGAGPYSISIGDIDFDGKDDLVTSNVSGNSVSVFRNTSTGVGNISYAARINFSTGTTPRSVTVGDLDGDDKLDLAVTAENPDIVSIFHNTSNAGNISFAARQDFATAIDPWLVAMADLDGDGKADLATANEGGVNVSVLHNTSTGVGNINFSTKVDFSGGGGLVAVSPGDFDNDGKSEIAAAEFNGDVVSVFRNTIPTATPTITSFSPTSGSAGTFVTISGSNFNTPFPSGVTFNGVNAPILDFTPTSISVSVPTGATTGPIQVIGCNTVTSASNFTIGTTATITITTQPSDFITCVGGIATFNTAASGTTNIIYRWQFSIDGVAPFTDINNGGGYSGATTATLTVNTTGNFGLGRYRGRVNGDFAAEVITNDEGLFINPIPTAPTATTATRCGPGSVTLTATGGSNGQYRWYTAATGGTAITGEVNSSYVTPAVTTSTTYFAAINNGSCESVRTPVVATINIPPTIPLITSSIPAVGNALTICSTTSLTLTAPAGFASYSWSTGATTQQITVSANGTYSVTVTDAGGCISPASITLVVTVLPAPCNNQPPVITTASSSTVIGGQAAINLLTLISDADNNIVTSSLVVIQQPNSGASATITNGVLEIDYKGVSFSGRDQLTIQVCDVFGECTQQVLQIDVIGDIEVYNGISPNNDNQNDIFLIQYIELLPDTQQNKVSIFNRWGSKVFEIDNYNNTSNVFRGLSNNGNELPSGTYFYKIEFTSGRKSETGYLTLRKP